MRCGSMAIHGETLYNIRRGVLALKRFTVEDLAERAGVGVSSTQRAVHKMVEEGYLYRGEGHVHTPGKGRPKRIYGLVADPHKVEELRAKVAAFREEHDTEREPIREPESPQYERALRVLDELERRPETTDPGRLWEVRRALAFARRAEEALDDGADEATPHLDLAEARLAWLAEEDEAAERLVGRARGAFERAGLPEGVRKADEYAAAARLRKALPALAEAAAAPAVGVADVLAGIGEQLATLAITPALALNVRLVLDTIAGALVPQRKADRSEPRGAAALLLKPKGFPSGFSTGWNDALGRLGRESRDRYDDLMAECRSVRPFPRMLARSRNALAHGVVSSTDATELFERSVAAQCHAYTLLWLCDRGAVGSSDPARYLRHFAAQSLGLLSASGRGGGWRGWLRSEFLIDALLDLCLEHEEIARALAVSAEEDELLGFLANFRVGQLWSREEPYGEQAFAVRQRIYEALEEVPQRDRERILRDLRDRTDVPVVLVPEGSGVLAVAR